MEISWNALTSRIFFAMVYKFTYDKEERIWIWRKKETFLTD